MYDFLLIKGENVDKFFYRVAGLTFNESIRNEIENKISTTCFKKLGAKVDLNEIDKKGNFFFFFSTSNQKALQSEIETF